MGKMKHPYMNKEQQELVAKVRREAKRLGFTVYLDRKLGTSRRYLRVKDYRGNDRLAWVSFVCFFTELFPGARQYRAEVWSMRPMATREDCDRISAVSATIIS